MAIYITDMPDDGWVRLPNELFRCGLSARSIAVLGNLHTHREDFNATIDLIAHQLEFSKPTVIAAINDLESIGVVQRVKVKGTGGKFDRNDYAISMQKLSEWAKGKAAAKGDAPGKKSLPGPGKKFLPGPGKKSLPIKDQVKNTTREDPPVVPPRGDAPAPAKTGPENPSKENEPAEKPKPAKRNDRGSRLEDGWMPSQKAIDQMRQECPHVNLEYEHRKFTDYWLSVPASKGRKSNWDATWRNWIRRASERPGGGNHYQPHRPPVEDQNNYEYYANRLIERLDAQEAQDTNQPQLATTTQWEITK